LKFITFFIGFTGGRLLKKKFGDKEETEKSQETSQPESSTKTATQPYLEEFGDT
jgi:hypothetical protein